MRGDFPGHDAAVLSDQVLYILHQFLVVAVEFDLFQSGHVVVLIGGSECAAKVAPGGFHSLWLASPGQCCAR